MCSNRIDNKMLIKNKTLRFDEQGPQGITLQSEYILCYFPNKYSIYLQ